MYSYSGKQLSSCGVKAQFYLTINKLDKAKNQTDKKKPP